MNAARLASLLGRLDSWMGASGYAPEHPWRIAIAEGLADRPAAEKADIAAAVKLAAVGALCSQVALCIRDARETINANDGDDMAIGVAVSALGGAGWLADRGACLAGVGSIMAADAWIAASHVLALVERAESGGP